MGSDAMERLVGEMTVADFCARLGCTVAELVERGRPPEKTASARPRQAAKPEQAPHVDPVADLMHLPLREARAEFEQRYIREVIAACSGNRLRASKRAGIARSALYGILNRVPTR